MKNIYTLLIVLFTFTFSNAQIVDIPDVNFKNALLFEDVADLNGNGSIDGDVDTNNDGQIQESEAASVYRLYINDFDISSLVGIESFTQMFILECHTNNITELDFSQNLELRELNCRYNSLTSLNVTQNSELDFLFCDYNELTELDVSYNGSLVELSCATNNLTTLTIGQTALQWLHCSYNMLTGIDVSYAYSLQTIDCRYNLIENFDLSNNTELTHLNCENNILTTLDLSQNIELGVLRCGNNFQLNTLDVSLNPNLSTFSCRGNQISNLDLSNNPDLSKLFATDNNLSSLDLSQNPNLRKLTCSFNNIHSLDLSANSNLDYLSCTDGQLVNLNVQNGNNINMNYFYSFNNPNLLCINVDDTNHANSQICDQDNFTGWCKDEWVEYSEECVLRIEDYTFTQITLYPNPTQDILNIETQQPIEFVKIYNLQGQLIKEGSSNNIDVSKLTTGLYFVQVTVEGSRVTKQFIKE